MVIDQTIVLFAAVGFVAQLIDGALGGGFGVIASSVLVATGVPPRAASAGIHVVKVITAPISGLSHAMVGNVDWPLLLRLAIPGVVGAVAGAWLLTGLPIATARLLIHGYLAVLGLLLLLHRAMHHAHGRRAKVVGPLGLVAGFFDSAGGGGWGPICTPTLIIQGTYPREAVGTVNMAEFIVAVASSATFLSLLGWETLTNAVLGLLAGAVVAAPFGALLAKRLPPTALVRLVGMLLLATSAFGITQGLLGG